ncbi:MAG: head GIN domain-containing protein [Sphingopyxis sp.]|uniref:head GIN domain-containing protein n=1 Tax=Sphingopyxis sp. TaxID=1908224 RepID=UPI002ABBFAD5|nr:head GIN domain-containing protein [Sphingopyxis sp.]MDZ3833569.1 head GIN domain-containing protein [Sphingopyxis sp.]
MFDWRMIALPVVLSTTVSGCDGAVSLGDGRSEAGSSAEAGAVGSRSYGFKDFVGVEVTGPDDVTIRQGDAFSIKASGSEAELEQLEIELVGDRLSIGRKSERFNASRVRSQGVKIAITMPRVTKLTLTGSGEVDADVVEGEAVSAVLTGSGDLKIGKLVGKNAAISLTGSGDLAVASGNVDQAQYKLSGSGDITASGLSATALDLSITGSGSAEAHATGAADVTILGSGDAMLTGGASCSTRTLGSGEVSCT